MTAAKTWAEMTRDERNNLARAEARAKAAELGRPMCLYHPEREDGCLDLGVIEWCGLSEAEGDVLFNQASIVAIITSDGGEITLQCHG